MPSTEFFYLTDDKPVDAELHDAILTEGDQSKAQGPVWRWLRQRGYSDEQISAFLGP